MPALLVAEHDAGRLKGASLNALSAARLMSDEVHVLVAGRDCRAIAEEAAGLEGVAKVLLAEAPQLEHASAEDMTAIVLALAKPYSHLAAPATTFGKNFMPRVAALLDVQQISDVSAVIGPDIFERPIYAGNAIARVKSDDPVKVVTVRGTAFPAAKQGGAPAPVEAVAVPASSERSRFEGAEIAQLARPELTAARIIVSGGRGLQSGENFKILERLADRLGAAVGASRAAVDAGFVPNDYQVGQTGKIVAPELYIAVGISGAIQHLAGMKDSKIIVAINKDEEAPIFQIADYGIVGDLFQIVPALEAELAKRLANR